MLQFVNAIRAALPASANVLVAITKITAGSVNVESSVTFLDGDTAAATAFATALATPSTIFQSSLGAATLSGSVTTQSVVGESCRQPSCVSRTCLVELPLPLSAMPTGLICNTYVLAVRYSVFNAMHHLLLCRLWTILLLQPMPLLQHPAAPQPPALPCWH